MGLPITLPQVARSRAKNFGGRSGGTGPPLLQPYDLAIVSFECTAPSPPRPSAATDPGELGRFAPHASPLTAPRRDVPSRAPRTRRTAQPPIYADRKLGSHRSRLRRIASVPARRSRRNPKQASRAHSDTRPDRPLVLGIGRVGDRRPRRRVPSAHQSGRRLPRERAPALCREGPRARVRVGTMAGARLPGARRLFPARRRRRLRRRPGGGGRRLSPHSAGGLRLHRRPIDGAHLPRGALRRMAPLPRRRGMLHRRRASCELRHDVGRGRRSLREVRLLRLLRRPRRDAPVQWDGARRGLLVPRPGRLPLRSR